ESFIRDTFAAGIPQVGICFGHQIIAQALGGKVEKFAGGWAIGHSTYHIDGVTCALNAWHQDQVTRLPPGAEVIGSNDFCAYAALRYDDRALTMQPHPEFGPEMIDKLLRLRAPGSVPDPLIARAGERLDAPIDDMAAADRIADFLRKGA
ncbi:MAG: type 1 glutamine amidotransferase, partial [Roseovarius sp.]|nr:type 1 glutamine amidotransferase [Roseovarius sp.]